jgi:hypothetical protein
MMTPETTTPTESEAKPIRMAFFENWFRDRLTISGGEGNATVSINGGTSARFMCFYADQTPHTVEALKALMVAIELDGGTVER